MRKLSLKKSLMAVAAAAVAVGAAAPASAGGRYHGYGHGHGHHYGKHYKKHHGYYYGSRHYRRHHHHGGLSGGEAALLALGIVGGVVLIDRALESERYASNDRYYAPPPPRDYYRRDDRAPQIYRDDGYSDRYDDYEDNGELLGGSDDYGYSGSRYNYGAAYNDCKAETRDAARQAGVIVSLPAKPDRIIEIDDGAAVRFTADYVASDRGGEYRRTMICEADEGGVRFLELV